MNKTSQFINNTFYNFFKQKAVDGAIWWLEKQDINKLKEILNHNNDLVPLIKPYLTEENLKKIPPYIRQAILVYLPSVKVKFINDIVNSLLAFGKYRQVLENNRKFLQENTIRVSNLLIVKLRELEKK